MRILKLLSFSLLFVAPYLGICQYTDVINSNRPGQSVSAYAVGKNVIQVEMGLLYEQQDHSLLHTESNILGTDLSLRYGFLFERLEINYEGTYISQKVDYLVNKTKATNTNFKRNRLGLKFLVYDPFKNEERNKPNLYSWKANHKFNWRNLLPAISIYGGANYLFEDNPFYVGDPSLSYRGMIVTQSKLTPRSVLILNLSYDKISTDDPEKGYLVSISHGFRNPKWSAFVENQGIQSNRYSDNLIRAGVAYLLHDDLQVDFNLGSSIKNTPSRIFITMGGSYRFDLHKDTFKAIEDQDADQNGGEIKKNAMKNKKKKSKKGSGAEDVDLGPSKKQIKKHRKKEKKKKKNAKKKEDGVIEF